MSHARPHAPTARRRLALRTWAALAAGLAGLLVTALLVATADAPRASAARGSATPEQSARTATPSRLSNGCRVSRRGVPSCGALVGAAHGANTEPAGLERPSGRPLGVRRTYYTASQVDSAVRTARRDVRRGRLPWISFKLPRSWEQMAAGDGDAWARGVARRLDKVPGPVWVAFHHEPEGDGDVQAWRKMQQRLAPLVRRTADNVGFTVVLTGWNQLYGDPAYRLGKIWPRGVKVDVAGFDVYNEVGVTKDGRTIREWPQMGKRYFRPFARWAKRHDVAWGIAETGLTHQAAAAYPGWIKATYRSLVRHGGVAFTYFDTHLNAYGSWPLTTKVKRKAFRATLRTSPRLSR
ncbi:hypothetical protein [Nocardioides deserti]|uniref:Glycoside hydrolase family 5 domain-containing protein n=1 Tax=Nocardioides deserti TaxID=1588644 RepID=A0ABR6U6D4_9ACTN|nr:hypothetical protein [Nocardioides deserti]MBC2959989.1 hypothetical protein [Nocardioides deserti]GGO75259.1 hypothetical protein GCM10012276_25190 [Nocardioides deserti]